MSQPGLSKFYNMDLTKDAEERKIMRHNLKRNYKQPMSGGSLTTYYNGGLSNDYGVPAMIQSGGSLTGHYNGSMSSNYYQGGRGFTNTLNKIAKNNMLATNVDNIANAIGMKNKIDAVTKGIYSKAINAGKQKGYNKRYKR